MPLEIFLLCALGMLGCCATGYTKGSRKHVHDEFSYAHLPYLMRGTTVALFVVLSLFTYGLFKQELFVLYFSLGLGGLCAGVVGYVLGFFNVIQRWERAENEEEEEEGPEEKPELVLANRLEHMQVIGSTGSGKSTALRELIGRDIEHNNTVIVIDHKDDVIEPIASIASDRIICLDPRKPIALNIFDLGRSTNVTQTLALFKYMFAALLDAEMTQRQSVPFDYIVQLLLEVPEAGLRDLLVVCRDGVTDRYRPYLGRLHRDAQEFFNGPFESDRTYIAARQELGWRIQSLVQNPVIAEMFNAPETKLDMFEEMNAGKVILIKTDIAYLQETGTKFLGRFFIALIMQAMQQRAKIPESVRKQTYLYIDEAQMYFDRKLEQMLDTARSYKVGVIFAHHDIHQLGDLRETVATNTAIKMVGSGVSIGDRRVLAPNMGTSEEYLVVPRHHFMIANRGYQPYLYQFNPKYLDRFVKRLDRTELERAMQERYGIEPTIELTDEYTSLKEPGNVEITLEKEE